MAAVMAAMIGFGMAGWGTAGGIAGWLLAPSSALAQAADTAVVEGEAEALDHEVADDAHAAEGGGMPQLDASTYASQILWLIITFSVLYYLLKRKALPRVADILEARQERIANDLDKAAALRAEAEEAQAEHERVVAKAQAEANAALKTAHDAVGADIAARTARLDAELASRIAEAEERIAAARKQALGELEDVAVEVAQAATARLTGVEVGLDEAKAALAAVRKEVA